MKKRISNNLSEYNLINPYCIPQPTINNNAEKVYK